MGADPVGADRTDPRLAVRAVGADLHLRAGEADGLPAEVVDRHRDQRDRHLLAGGEEHVHLARRGLLAHLPGEVHQDVRLMPHGRNDHHHLRPLLLGAERAAGGGADLLGIGNTRAAKLLNDKRHKGTAKTPRAPRIAKGI